MVNNLINDDLYGETQTISKVSIYKNVGITINVLEELANNINITCTDKPLKLRSKEDKIDNVAWTKICTFDITMEEAWQHIELDVPVETKYVRVELVKNFCPHGESFIPWIETSKIKIY